MKKVRKDLRNDDIVGIYHADCKDGVTAAAVLLTRFPGIALFPLNHDYPSEALAPIKACVTANTTVYTLDCALGVKELLPKAKKVIVLDHHIGIKDEFEELATQNEKLTFIFDNDKSGASLAWSYFYGDAPMPDIIKYVEDNDLWRFRYGDKTKYAILFLSEYTEPKQIEKLFTADSKMMERMFREGETIARHLDGRIEHAITSTPPVVIKVGPYEVDAYNTPEFMNSVIGNKISLRDGKAVALFTILSSTVKVSFRSKSGNKPDALALAKLLGGGGHENAAAAHVPLKNFFGSIKL
jgi:oligoribonuclease NrnB/cAMP/cGMP phosphodiesterase (DHH superfamily)